MAHPVYVRYIKDKASAPPAALIPRYQGTWDAYMKAGESLDSDVIMTGSTGQFGSATGVVNQSPLNRVAAYQQAIDDILAELAGDSPSSGDAAGTYFANAPTRI